MALFGNNAESMQVLVTSKGDTKGIDDTSKSLGNLDKSAESNSKVMQGLAASAKVAALAIATAGAALAGAAAFGVKSAAEFQQTRIGLENMLGSADLARSLLSDISKFAAETPFEFPELAQATRQLVAFGFTGDQAFQTMKQLGDVSAAIGTPINDLAYLMGTLRTQGRAFTIDIRQFAQRGIPIYEYLAKVLQTNEKAIAGMIEEGKIGFPEVQKAFELMTSEGQKFHGTMSKQSKSLSGLFSTLKDNIGQTARELVGITQEGDIKEGSLFDGLQKGATFLIANLPVVIQTMQQWGRNIKEVAIAVGDYLTPKLVALWNTVQEDMIPVFKRLWHEVIEPLVPVLGTIFVGAIGFVIDALNLLLKALEPVINFLINNEWIFWTIIGALGILKTALMLQGALAAFTTVMTGITTQFAAVSAIIAAPIVMPAIVVAAALAALWQVRDAAFEAYDAVQKANQAKENLQEAKLRAIKTYVPLTKSPFSAETQQRARNVLKAYEIPGYADGGFTGRGNENDFAGVVHKGEYVIPKEQVNQNTGTPKNTGVTIHQTNIINNQMDLLMANRELGWRLQNA